MGHLGGNLPPYQDPSASKPAEDAPAPFSLRLTFEERASLELAAGDMPLGAYIRDQVLKGGRARKRRRYRRPVKDQQALGQLLGALGESHLANNLNQLAKSANTGSLAVTPETEKALRDACAEVHQMRALLMRALGFEPEGRRG
jgi:hypothetical protein